jgi:F-type H+-transporting ATPase subunit delta
MSTAPEMPRKLHPTVLDTSVVQVAQVYARALYDAASKTNQLDLVLDEYESLLRDVLGAHPDFERMFTSAIIGRNEKAETLRRALEGRASQIFLNFMLVLSDHLRLDLLRPVLTQIQAIRDQRLGLVPVEVRAAVPLDAAQEQALRDRLRSVIAGTPILHSQVDPALLGGLVIRVGDKLYDGSVRTQLRRLREQFLERSIHEIQSRRDQFSPAT